MSDTNGGPDLISLTAEIVSAFVANNPIKSGEVATLIRETHGALASLGTSPPAESPREPEFKPAVSVRKSLASRDHIISLVDGKPYKTLTRHLARHGLTPAEYRARYGLPKDYPMVAPTYSEARRAMAKKIGLGKLGHTAKARKAKAPARNPPRGKRGAQPKTAKA